MDSFEPKKLALIRILHILERYTDSSHPMTHDEIINKLYNLYGISVERKAIGRNISLLQDAGYDIETTKKGSVCRSRRRVRGVRAQHIFLRLRTENAWRGAHKRIVAAIRITAAARVT